MPFDLKIHYVPINDTQTWTMEGPSWLDGAPLPVDRSLMREVGWQGYRDLVMSAGELNAWHEKEFGNLAASYGDQTMSERTLEQLHIFSEKVGRSQPNEMYLLHWYEWD